MLSIAPDNDLNKACISRFSAISQCELATPNETNTNPHIYIFKTVAASLKLDP